MPMWVKEEQPLGVQLPWVIDHQITIALMDRCQDEQKKISWQKRNSKTTTLLAEDRDLTGSLGQNGVEEVIRDWEWDHGISLVKEFYPYFNPNVSSDKYDFITHRGQKVDVKSKKYKPEKQGVIDRRYKFYVLSEDRDFGIDIYVFSAVDYQNQIIKVAGAITHEDFWRSARFSVFRTHDNKEVESGWVYAIRLKPLFDIISI